MSKFDIFTDSICDLSASQEKEYDITILPTGVTVLGKSFMHYADCRELSMEKFYTALRSGLDIKTFATSPMMFAEAAAKSLEDGRDVVIITASSEVSSVYQNAVIAVKELKDTYPERKIVVINSLCASSGLGLLVKMASDFRRDGMGFTQTVAHIEAAKKHLCQIFTVDNLMHLRRGGRISPAVAIVGSALAVKPIMNVDNAGRLVATGTTRGRKKAIATLAEKMKKSAIEPENQHIFISQADCEQDAMMLAGLIREKMKVKDITINQIGPSVAAHGGCGSLALFFIGSYREGAKK